MKLKAYLEHEKITATAFGEKVGVSNKQTMSRYIRGDRFPPPKVLQRISTETDGKVTADDFVAQHLEPPTSGQAAA